MPPTWPVPIPRPHGGTSTSHSISCDRAVEVRVHIQTATPQVQGTNTEARSQIALVTGEKEIAMNSMKGTVVSSAYPTLRVHTYVSPRDVWLVTTPIV